MPTTSRTGTPYPAYSDVPDVPADLQASILALEPYTNLRYASTAARDADISSPVAGMQCNVAGLPYIYTSGAWQRVLTADTAAVAGNVSVGGILTAQNRVMGTITVTPSAANVATSGTVTFSKTLTGSTFYVALGLNSSVPGNTVTGISWQNCTNTGMLVWVCRTNTTNTAVSYIVEGV